MMLGSGNLFHIVDDVQVILRTKGVFKQVKVYSRAGPSETRLYAGYGAGFIRLDSRGHTSHPNVSWDGINDPSQVTGLSRTHAPVLKV